MHPKFDPHDVTKRVDFGAAVDTSKLNNLNVLITGGANGLGTPGVPIPIHENVSLDEDPPAPATVTLDVTLTGVYFSTCLAIHYMRLPSDLPVGSPPKQQIIFMGSLASYVEIPPVADYGASKFGVRGLWKSIRREVPDLNIRTNLIAPTFMPTVMVQQVTKALEERGAKVGKIEDVVDAVVRLACSDDVDGRALACGGDGIFDLRDDYEGLDGGVETLDYFKTGAFGGGMRHFKEVLGGRKW
ncbi:MAG: hypothetical protein Q9162_001449 [Coniocarpon cinnabarinum]